jgi:hypothetical protein
MLVLREDADRDTKERLPFVLAWTRDSESDMALPE